MPLEKNSVVQDKDSKKTSSPTSPDPQSRCPFCGQVAELRGQVLACPTHGTAPWEAQRK